MGKNNKSITQVISQIFNVLFIGISFLLFIPTGLLLFAAIASVYANDWAQIAFYILGIASFTVLVGIIALVPSRFFSILGMFIVVFAMATFGAGTASTALSQMPPSVNFAAMIGMSFALTVTHVATWQVVRNLAKVEPAPAATTTTSALAGTALKTTKP